MKARPLAKEEDVLKDLSLYFCPSTPDVAKRTLFWLPASDGTIEHSERMFIKQGFPSVAPNSEFFTLFPEYCEKYNPTEDTPMVISEPAKSLST
jgi:hypothetical protein